MLKGQPILKKTFAYSRAWVSKVYKHFLFCVFLALVTPGEMRILEIFARRCSGSALYVLGARAVLNAQLHSAVL